jgi:hypothetical protein
MAAQQYYECDRACEQDLWKHGTSGFACQNKIYYIKPYKLNIQLEEGRT